MSTHTTEIEAKIKALKKQAGEIERGLRDIRETEENLGHWEPELERLRKSTDITNDAQLDALARARQRVQICLDIRESAPSTLEAPIRKTATAIDLLNDSLRAAAREEREQIIQEATNVIGPFAGTQQVDELNGEVSNPARQIAETLPILEAVPSDLSNIFQSAAADNIEHRGYAKVAESVLVSARAALAVADAWLKAGGKFVTTKLQ